MPLLEWLANNYKSFGATLEIITDRSQEGSQFVRGFGGVGGMLRLVALGQQFHVAQLLQLTNYLIFQVQGRLPGTAVRRVR